MGVDNLAMRVLRDFLMNRYEVDDDTLLELISCIPTRKDWCYIIYSQIITQEAVKNIIPDRVIWKSETFYRIPCKHKVYIYYDEPLRQYKIMYKKVCSGEYVTFVIQYTYSLYMNRKYVGMGVIW